MAVRIANSVVFFAGSTFLTIGGFEFDYAPLNNIYIYNLDREQWSKHVIPKDEPVPQGTDGACAVAVGRDIFIHGGQVFDIDALQFKGITGTLWKLSKTTCNNFKWHEVKFHSKKTIPSPRWFHRGWEYDDKMWTFGGMGSSPDGYLNNYGDWLGFKGGLNPNISMSYFCNQLNCFDPTSQKWTDVQSAGAIPSPRDAFGCTKIKNKVFIHGGRFADVADVSCRTLDDMYELNLLDMTWKKFEIAECLVPSQRCLHSFTSFTDSKIILHGGCLPHIYTYNEVWILDLKTLRWEEFTVNEDDPRCAHTATEGNNEIIIIGGLAEVNELVYPQSVLHIRLLYQPQMLQQLVLRSVYKHKDVLEPQSSDMPDDMYERFQDMVDLL